MAWDGTVIRHFWGITPEPSGGCTIHFDCGHDQRSCRPMEVILKWYRHEYICQQCSEPQRERIRKIQESISFDDALQKVKNLYRSKGPEGIQ